MRTTIQLRAGEILTVTADDNTATGSVRRLAAPGSTTQYAAATIAASGSASYGPFTADRGYLVTATDGDLTIAVSRPDVAATGSGSPVLATAPTLASATLTAPTLSSASVVPAVATASANGAITIAPGVVKITKSAAAAELTLAAPTAGQDGVILRIVSTTAKAHTVTATGLIDDGVTGGSKDAVTFAAYAGASVTLIALAQKWSVLAANNVTIA